MGFAVVCGTSLLYHGVEVFSDRSTPDCILASGREKVRRLIRDFRPAVLAIEKTFFTRYRNTAILHVFADEIRKVGRREGLRVIEIAPNTARKIVAGNGWATKDEVARALVGRWFPELRPYLSSAGTPRWKRLHHANRTDAISIATATHLLAR